MSEFTSTLIHVDLIVSDVEKSIEYYGTFLGFQVIEDCLVDGDVVTFLSNGQASKMRLIFCAKNKRSTMIELIQFFDGNGKIIEPSDKTKLNLSLSFLVPDVDEVISTFQQNGIAPETQVFSIDLKKLGKTKIVFFKDPNGYLIEFVSSF